MDDGVDVHCGGGGSKASVCIMGQLETMNITIDSNGEAECEAPILCDASSNPPKMADTIRG